MRKKNVLREFQMMQAHLDQMNARINNCSNTEVGSSNFFISKALFDD